MYSCGMGPTHPAPKVATVESPTPHPKNFLGWRATTRAAFTKKVFIKIPFKRKQFFLSPPRQYINFLERSP